MENKNYKVLHEDQNGRRLVHRLTDNSTYWVEAKGPLDPKAAEAEKQAAAEAEAAKEPAKGADK